MDLASLIIGIVALVVGVMAVPTILQMLFGRPKLHFEADDFTGPDGRILVIAIKNTPVKNWLLRCLGVERESGDVIAFFDVHERGTGKIIRANTRGLLQCSPLREMGLRVPAMPGFTVGLAIISTKDGAAGIVDPLLDNSVPIPVGEYTAHIAIMRGQITYGISQDFRVKELDHETIWYSRNVVSKRK